MKKNILILFSLIILLCGLASPFYTFAVNPEIKSVNLIKEEQNTSGKWNWEFDIETTNVSTGSKMVIDIYEGGVKVSTKQENINNNYLNYFTDYTLGDKKTYVLFFTLANSNPVVRKIYTKTTGTTGQNIPPTILSVLPNEGREGNTITINGSNFTGATNVTIGSVDVGDITKDSDTQIRFSVPANATNGKIGVKTPRGIGYSTNTFKILNDPVILEGKKDQTLDDGVYTLLAPIGGLKEAPKNIGDYFNTIFKIAIGLCGALAVIMIVLGGVQYMGNESIFGQTEAKKKIMAAILGLIIALGSYALLNTLNPALLGKDGITIAQVSAEIEEEDFPLTSNDQFVSGQKTEKCTGGIVYANTANGNIPTCSTLKTKVETLISDANKAGYKIFGYGYRSKERQEQLRAQNCGGTANIYNASAKCNPLTAYPGKSMHENGLAIDFTCDGSTIRSRDNKCFIWLKNNASKYNFINLQKEPWHWSTNGH